MRLAIRGTNIRITESIRAAVIRNVLKISMILRDPEISVKLAVLPDGQKAEITVSVPGCVLHAEKKKDSLYDAIDEAGEKIVRQAGRYRKKVIDAGRRKKAGQSESSCKNASEITRIYELDSRPMPADEAVEQLKATGASFMVFRDADTDGVCTVYARKDGTFGLIVPGGER